MITYHQSFSTRIFLNRTGGAASRDAANFHAGLAGAGDALRKEYHHSRIVIAVKSALRGTERPAKITPGGGHAR